MPNLKEGLARVLHRLGLTADLLTFLGLVSAFVSAFFIIRGRFFMAGGFLLLSGGLDLMDGAVARVSGKVSVFGGILDSTLDRYGDGFVLLALIFYYLNFGRSLYALLASSALLGTFAISYVRARAECEIDGCRVGFWERGERIVYVSLGLLFHNTACVLWVLGLGTHWTVLNRLVFAKKPDAAWEGNWRRRGLRYAAKVAGLVLLVLLWRPIP